MGDENSTPLSENPVVIGNDHLSFRNVAAISKMLDKSKNEEILYTRKVAK